MNTANHAFLISQLRAKNSHKTMEAVAMFVMVFFVLALLPQLLVRYVYGNQLVAEPQALAVMPVIGFAVGVGYYLWVVFGNMRREMEARRLEKELVANSWSPAMSESGSVAALQEAMADVEMTMTKTPSPRRSTRGRKPGRRRSA